MSADSSRPPPPSGSVPEIALAAHDALPAGTRFGEFEIIRVLGVGGFGIVYLAQDHSLERQVALKEYMPASLAERGDGPLITVRSGAHTETYAIGLRSFINEARLLARFDHPALVKVYRFWEDNATAYMVMPYLQGITLRDARRGMAQSPDEAWIRGVLDPMLDALEQLHREDVYHRDIAPDNILLPPLGSPILLDFGAARRVISDRTQSLTAILKPSYAPIEQYAEMTAMRQGPWTDIYALGAVLHFLLFAAPPAPATARALQSDVGQIEHRVVPGVSPRFIALVAWMLGVRPSDRPQSVAELRAVLNGQGPVPTATPALLSPVSASVSASIAPSPSRPDEAQADDTVSRPSAADVTEFPPTQLAAAYLPTVVLGRSGVAPADQMPVVPMPMTSELSSPIRRRGWMAAGLGVGLVVAGVVLWQFVGLLGGTRPNGEAALAAGPIASQASSAPGAMGLAAPGPSTVATRTADAAPAAASAASAQPTPAVSADAPRSQAVLEAAAPAAATRAPTLGPVLVLAGGVAAAPAASAASGAASRPRPTARPVNLRNSEAAATSARAALAGPAADNAVARPGSAGGARDSTSAPRAVAAPMTGGPLTAREACGNRSFISLAICMDRECEQPQFRDNPECVRVLNVKRQRAER